MPSGRKQLGQPGRFAGKALPGFSMTVDVNRLETEAYLSIERYPEVFDATKAVEIIRKEIADCLPFGVDERFLKTALPEAVGRRRLVAGQIIASGIQPVDGDPAEIEFLIPRPSKECLMQPDGTLDFKTRDLFRSVSTDEIILVKKQPTPGKAGISVFGTPIPPVPGRDRRVIAGKNVSLRIEGGMEVYAAACEGQVIIESGVKSVTVHVAPVLEISGNVDYETGNISFKGSVIVHGSILSGFSVNVTGNLRVDGLIEPATTVTVGGDLDVGKGILGSADTPEPSETTGGIRVFGNLRALYAENAFLAVQGDLFLRSALNCRIRANGEVAIEKALIGGETIAFHSITAGEIGNEVGLKTIVSCGLSPTTLNQLNLVVKVLDDIRKQHAELEKNLHFVIRHPERVPGDKAALLRTSLEQKLVSLADQVTKLEVKKADLALLLLEEHIATISAGTLHEGTVLSIRNSRLVIDTERRFLTYAQKLPEEILECRPYQPGSRKSGKVRP
ncbi:MAG TPA: FapA family protein [Candidatus Ozemobacteraceae bacterium]|nr:FapA family protein [Candidatus Ozemobacteraceae bacterium]